MIKVKIMKLIEKNKIKCTNFNSLYISSEVPMVISFMIGIIKLCKEFNPKLS